MILACLPWLLAAALPATAPTHARPVLEPRSVSTFSIVAVDPANGDLGVAVASRYFSVGSVVPWALAGVGAVATQANVNVGYGPRGIDLLRQGLTAPQVLEKLLAEDTFDGKDGRQVAIVDAHGNIAAFTGTQGADTGREIATAPTGRPRATSWWGPRWSRRWGEPSRGRRGSWPRSSTPP